ncbi:hypothetical protein BJX63DRAFT_417348 [Aspergillus granulosus]|uniref:AAA+ ATPase domain-containing protein n=1 Tax=Aspergillus granulosus TaxID=176169 RepID=A0ABR4I5N5_9EURO
MRPRSRSDFAIAIICALPLEADAVEALFDEHYDRLGKYYGKQQGDANAYINGRIGKHDVVLCYMPGMGKGSAARVMSSLQVSYTSTKLALVVGICGGAPSSPENEEIFLGNVIISDSVVEYDFGRQYPGGFQRKVKDTLGRPGREIRTLLNGLRAKSARKELGDQTRQYLHILQQREAKWCHPGLSDILFEASYLHKHYCHASPARCSCFGSDQICEEALGKDCDDLNCDKGQQIRCREASEAIPTTIYIGPVASADTVMKSGQHRDEIIRNEKVIGFEMEGAGVWDDIPCIIIKGVCDYADSHKNKLWQAYAAATGASAAKAFLGYWMPANHKDTGQNRHLMIPFARNPHFMGRQEEIQKIEELISKPNGPKKLAITGLGGVGKTQIALELVYRMREREPECSIFWIPCTSYEAVEQACMTIAQMVGIHDIEPAKVKERLKAYFSQINKKWILIFDNADEMDMWINGSPTAQPLKNIIPRSENGHVLFTSRNRKLALQLASSVLPIPDVDQQTAKEIFRNLLIRKDLLQDNHITYALLEQLAFLPLAISQAAAYINQNDISLARYMSLLNEQEGSIIELLSEEFMDDGRYTEIQNTVATTWLVSFTQIQQVDEVASDYLSFMACISPRDIPESILPSTASAKRKVEALGLLKAYSFVSVHVDDSVLSLHRLVHLVTRNWLRKRETFEWSIERAAEQLDKTFPNSNHSNRQIWRDYLPHALYLVDSEEFQRDNHDDFLARLGSCLENDGRYAEAETLFLDVLKVQERACGPEDPDTLTSVSQLGSYEEAEAMHRRDLAGSEKVLGPEHPDTLTSMANLAIMYFKQEHLKEAEELETRVLEIRKRVLGPEHPDTLTSMSNHAFTMKQLGNISDALSLIKKCADLRNKVLGSDHPHAISSSNALRNWETASKQFSESQKQHASTDNPPTLTLVHTYAGDDIASSKPAGRKRRAFMNFFRRGPSL